MITSSEICLLKLVIKIIEIGRDENQIELTSIEIPLILMNVISDLYCNCNLNNFSNLNSFKEFLRSYIIEDEFINGIINLSDFNTIDDLLDLFDSIPNYLICPDNLSPNKVLSPYYVTSESVIGLTLRSLSVKWESLIFEDICVIYDDLILFLQSSTLSPKDYDHDNANTKRSGINHLHSADELSKNMDVVSAIDHLHMYYDLSQRDSIQSSYMTPHTLHLPNPAKKHQQAMLSMATIFIRSGNVAQAINSVEEALKTSHQRNDKQSVSQALLLLQYIIFVSNESSLNHVKKVKMESTLHHLTGRFNELNLKSFAASARLLLTRVKLKGQISLKEFDLQSKLPKEYNGSSKPYSDNNHIHIQEIWMNLLLVQLGEFPLHDSISNSNSSPIKPPNTPQPESTDKGPLTLEELGSLPLQVSLIYTKTLIKLGLFDMAIFECKKTLHSCLINPSIVDKEDLISICCIWAKLNASRSFDYSIVILFHDSSRHSDHSIWYQESVQLIEYVIKEFNIDEKDVSFDLLNSSLITIRLWQSVQFKNYSEALSLVKILIEILEPDSPKTKPKSEYIEALLIYSSLLFSINIDESNLEIINAIELTSIFGMLYHSAIATILKTLQDLNQKPEDEKAAVIVYKNIRDLAYLQVIPELVRISIIFEEMIDCKDKKLMSF